MHWGLLLVALWLAGFSALWALVHVGARSERAEAPAPQPKLSPERFAQTRPA